VVLVREPVLLALQEQRYFSPIELSVGVTEHTGAVVPGFCHAHAFGVAVSACGFYRGSNFLLVVFCKSVLDMLGKVVNIGASVSEHAPHGAHGGDDLAVAFGRQAPNYVAKPGAVACVPAHGNLRWKRHDDPSELEYMQTSRGALSRPARSLRALVRVYQNNRESFAYRVPQ
jgi:hypothetical protein